MAEGLSPAETLNAKWLRRSFQAAQNADSFPPALSCVLVYITLHILIFFHLLCWPKEVVTENILAHPISLLSYLINIAFTVWLCFDFYAWITTHRKRGKGWFGAYLMAFVLLMGIQLILESWRMLIPNL